MIMGRRGKPPKVKEEEVQEEEPQEIENIEPKEEEIEVSETDEEVEEPIPKPKETIDFDLTKQNPYLVAGFKASNLYDESLGNTILEERFEEFKQKGSEIK